MGEIEVKAKGITLGFDARFGVITRLSVVDAGRDVAPFHRAPWVGREAMPDGAAPHMAVLGGDFFCAPFGRGGGGVPLHGWPPNSAWEVQQNRAGVLEADLIRSVSGARLVKRLELRDGQPFLYQSHVFTGGDGPLPMANHACIALPNGGHIRCSPKQLWRTGPASPESDPARGRSSLRYPASSADPAHFPALTGEADLTRYPWADAAEDFVIGLEHPDSPLGWTAITRPQEGDLYLSLRNPRALPMTMLWHSNGGRDYAPWNGRHRGCLGVEEGCAPHLLSRGDLPPPPRLSGSPLEVRHLTGAIAWPSGAPVASVVPSPEGLRITGEDGHARLLPCDPGFLFA